MKVVLPVNVTMHPLLIMAFGANNCLVRCFPVFSAIQHQKKWKMTSSRFVPISTGRSRVNLYALLFRHSIFDLPQCSVLHYSPSRQFHPSNMFIPKEKPVPTDPAVFDELKSLSKKFDDLARQNDALSTRTNELELRLKARCFRFPFPPISEKWRNHLGLDTQRHVFWTSWLTNESKCQRAQFPCTPKKRSLHRYPFNTRTVKGPRDQRNYRGISEDWEGSKGHEQYVLEFLRSVAVLTNRLFAS